MLTTKWLVHCALAFATTTFSSHHIQYQLNSGPEQPIGLDGSEFSKNPLFSLHKKLVNIESISGNEQSVGEFLEAYLISHNYTVERQYVGPLPTSLHDLRADEREQKQRFNLLAYPGENRQTPVLFSSHIDTVPPHYGYETHEHDEIWGRGSVDAKACVATQLQATQELLASREISPNDVSFLFVVGEETGGDGMRRVNDLQLEWKTVIFGEPTELKLASGHKGNLIFTVKARGKAGHSGYPWLGQSANHMLVPALVALQKLELPSSEKYGNSTLNIGQIMGGIAASERFLADLCPNSSPETCSESIIPIDLHEDVIAEEAYARISIRIAAGSPEIVKKLVSDAVKAVDDLEIDFSDGSYSPVYIDSDVEGFETITVNYGTDIPNLRGNHKRYLYGPGSILVAHSDHEHLKASHLLTAVEGYKRLVRSALKS